MIVFHEIFNNTQMHLTVDTRAIYIKIEILPLLDFRDLLFSTKTKVKIITRVKAMTLDNKHILGSGLLGECEMG